MALSIRLTTRAIHDLQEIRAYLLPRSPRGADRVRREIDRTILALSHHPGIGIATRVPGVRAIKTRRHPYIVYHQAADAVLVVVHIRHGARAAPALADLRGI